MLKGKDLLIKRIEKSLFAKDIAKQIGISNAYICMMEKGKCSIPTNIYEKWIEALGITNEEEMSD